MTMGGRFLLSKVEMLQWNWHISPIVVLEETACIDLIYGVA